MYFQRMRGLHVLTVLLCLAEVMAGLHSFVGLGDMTGDGNVSGVWGFVVGNVL